MHSEAKISVLIVDDHNIVREGLRALLQRQPHLEVVGESVDGISTVSSRKEREVLQLVAEGRPTKDIALRLKVSVKTVDKHRARIMEKLNIHSVAELTKFAIREGLTPLER